MAYSFSKTKSLWTIPLLTLLIDSAFAAGCGGGGGGAVGRPPQGPPTTPDAISAIIRQNHPDLPPVDIKVTTPSTVVAKVVWTKGTVKVMGPDKKVRELKPNSVIDLNDAIITDGTSQAEIVFTDNTIMTFKEKTVFYIDKYEFHPEVKKGSSGKYIMDLIEGGYRTVTGTIAKTNSADYQVKTDVALMGVRGTDYSAFFSACKVFMKRHTGTPILQNDKGTIVLNSANPYATVPAFNQPPVRVAQEPAVFKVPVKITPATFNLSSLPGQGGGGGGGGGNCAPIPGQFTIKFR